LTVNANECTDTTIVPFDFISYYGTQISFSHKWNSHKSRLVEHQLHWISLLTQVGTRTSYGQEKTGSSNNSKFQW